MPVCRLSEFPICSRVHLVYNVGCQNIRYRPRTKVSYWVHAHFRKFTRLKPTLYSFVQILYSPYPPHHTPPGVQTSPAPYWYKHSVCTCKNTNCEGDISARPEVRMNRVRYLGPWAVFSCVRYTHVYFIYDMHNVGCQNFLCLLLVLYIYVLDIYF